MSVDQLEDSVLMKNLPMSRYAFPGVYELVDLRTLERYVGSSRCMLHRAKSHRNELRLGTHPYTQLVEAYKLGLVAVLFIGDDGRPLIVQENERIAFWRTEGLCLNRQCSEEWRKKQSDEARQQHAEGKFGYDPETAKKRIPWDKTKPHGLKGRKQTEEHKCAAVLARTEAHNRRYRERKLRGDL